MLNSLNFVSPNLSSITDSTFAGTLAFLGPIGWPEMLAIGLVALLIFGSRLPKVARSVGEGIVEFKKGLSGVTSDIENTAEATDPPKLEDKAESAETASSAETEKSTTAG